MRREIFLFIIAIGLASCGSETNKSGTEKPAKSVKIPDFSPDSAFFFVQKQVDFGPRIPNSAAHRKTGDYFLSQFKKYKAVVTVQEFTAVTFDKQNLKLRNIIASFQPEKKKRILLAAHWDTRPFADKDQEKPNAQIDGANDGASGVAVLLEIARLMSTNPLPEVGIDIILFDGEDWGEKEGQQNTHPLPANLSAWWCLGSQHWSRNKHTPNYAAAFGILLDMVGGKNAQFAREGYSTEYAPGVVDKIWNAASRVGYSHIFIHDQAGFVLDDHKFVNELGKIPMVDIVSYDQISGFGDFHHTLKDNMDLIDKATLHAVGITLLHVIYSE
jgi:glutaminyl-peptide cyclotransferase